MAGEPALGGLRRHRNQVAGGKALVEQVAHPFDGLLARVSGGAKVRKACGLGGKLPGKLGPHSDHVGRGRELGVLGSRHRGFLLRKSCRGGLARCIIAEGARKNNRGTRARTRRKWLRFGFREFAWAACPLLLRRA